MSEPLGIIYPPTRELRDIVDSTAKYVAKNGGAFEERIKREHRDKPKFSFLLPGDPFNSYYQYKVKEIRNLIQAEAQQQDAVNKTSAHDRSQSTESDNNLQNQGSDKHNSQSDLQSNSYQSESDKIDDNLTKTQEQELPRQDETSKKSEQTEEADDFNEAAPRVSLKLHEYIQEMTMKLEEPPKLNYLATSGPSINNIDCDIIKLTAQFISTYGRSFLLELDSREKTNSQFDFLRPQHGQFSYLSNLIMQYAIIRNQPLDITEHLTKDATSQKHVLDKIKMRAEWTKMLELERRKQEEAEEREKFLYSQIDWQDFVIVSPTIEEGEYPPTTADQVGTRFLLQQRQKQAEVDMDIESDPEEDG